MERRKARKLFYAGAAAGAAVTIAVALLMDVFYADALGGTWRDAIVKDMKSLFGATLETGSMAVTAVFLVILSVLGLFGALAGFIFTAFVVRFLDFLVRK